MSWLRFKPSASWKQTRSFMQLSPYKASWIQFQSTHDSSQDTCNTDANIFASEISSDTDPRAQIDRYDRHWPLIHSRAVVEDLGVTWTAGNGECRWQPATPIVPPPLHPSHSVQDIKCHRKSMFKVYNLWYLIIPAWHLLDLHVKYHILYETTPYWSLPPPSYSFVFPVTINTLLLLRTHL